MDHFDSEYSEIQSKIFYSMTPEERWRVAMRLSHTARELKAAAIRTFEPTLSEKEIQEKVKRIFMYARS